MAQAAGGGIEESRLNLARAILRLRGQSQIRKNAACSGMEVTIYFCLVSFGAILMNVLISEQIHNSFLIAGAISAVMVWFLQKLRLADAAILQKSLQEGELAEQLLAARLKAPPLLPLRVFFWKLPAANETCIDFSARSFNHAADCLIDGSGSSRLILRHRLSRISVPLGIGLSLLILELMPFYIVRSPDGNGGIETSNLGWLLCAFLVAILHEVLSRTDIAREQLALACEHLLGRDILAEAEELEKLEQQQEELPAFNAAADQSWRERGLSLNGRVVDDSFTGSKPPPGRRLGRDENFVDMMRRADDDARQ